MDIDISRQKNNCAEICCTCKRSFMWILRNFEHMIDQQKYRIWTQYRTVANKIIVMARYNPYQHLRLCIKWVHPPHFLFSTRIWAAETAIFTHPSEPDDWYLLCVDPWYDFPTKYGIKSENLRNREHATEDLATNSEIKNQLLRLKAALLPHLQYCSCSCYRHLNRTFSGHYCIATVGR